MNVYQWLVAGLLSNDVFADGGVNDGEFLIMVPNGRQDLASS